MSVTARAGRRTAPCTDLRDWLRKVDRMGELRRVEGATWQEDIGRISEMLHHTEESPCSSMRSPATRTATGCW